MMKSYSNMFVIVSDLARIQEEYIEYPSHENKMLAWQETYHSSLKRVLNDSEFDERSIDKAKNVESLLFSMYDIFHKHSSISTNREDIKSRVDKIYKKHQVEQRTTQWYEDMKIMLTASEFSKLFDSERTRGNLVLSKVNPEKRDSNKALMTSFMSPMDWGVRFEPVVKQYLEDSWKCKIYDCGRLKHETQNHLGASPDGIIVTEESDKYGRLVEIKCPFSRKIGGAVPFDYWVQMQIQLEVTNLFECEYVEVEILSKTPKNMNPDLSGNSLQRGTVYLVEKDGECAYSYSEENRDTYLQNGYELLETIEYSIVKVHNVLVKRDTKWFEGTLEAQAKFWEDVEKARNSSFVVAEPRFKKPKPCLIVEES